MSAPGFHAITDLVTVLSANWTAASTDNKTPTITDSLTKSWDDLELRTVDTLYVKFDADAVKTGFYGAEFFHSISCSIEVIVPKINSSADGGSHFTKVMDEAVRIIKANPRYTGYAEMVVKSIGPPRYNKDKAVFLCPIDVEFLKVRTS